MGKKKCLKHVRTQFSNASFHPEMFPFLEICNRNGLKSSFAFRFRNPAVRSSIEVKNLQKNRHPKKKAKIWTRKKNWGDLHHAWQSQTAANAPCLGSTTGLTVPSARGLPLCFSDTSPPLKTVTMWSVFAASFQPPSAQQNQSPQLICA